MKSSSLSHDNDCNNLSNNVPQVGWISIHLCFIFKLAISYYFQDQRTDLKREPEPRSSTASRNELLTYDIDSFPSSVKESCYKSRGPFFIVASIV